jgi:hypothetical protein
METISFFFLPEFCSKDGTFRKKDIVDSLTPSLDNKCLNPTKMKGARPKKHQKKAENLFFK